MYSAVRSAMTKTKPKILDFTLKSGGKVNVEYRRGVFGGGSEELDYRTDHFEFRGDDISSTGYNSQFCVVSYHHEEDWQSFAKQMAEELYQKRQAEIQKNPLQNNLSLF